MSRNIKFSLALGLIIAGSTAAFHMGNAAASESHRHRHVAHHPRRDIHVAQARSHADPRYPASYALYQYLKDGTEWCWLPSEPCDNNHRMAN